MSKHKDWNPLIDKFKARLSGWKMRTMSFGGRVVLIKSVLNSLPLYYLSLFRPPQRVLKLLESRLFRLEESPNATIKDRVGKSDNGLTTTWNWSRSPTGRTTGELDSLISLLSSFSFEQSKKDVWKWGMSSNGLFTVKKCSSILDEHILGSVSSQHGTLRNPLVPKKIEIFVWQALKNRFPARLELDKRGMDLHSVRCPLCDDALESVENSPILYKHARKIWERVYKWWGVGNLSCASLSILLDDSSTLASSDYGKVIWQALKWICTYLIWKNRNNKVFRDKNWNPPVALNEIQVMMFEWISARSKKKKFEWLSWLSNPNVYLNVS
ncbi:uncharacterized protein [Rutidosis leptorrhynchoides]|uniref:uncharacterized protein n=1 Tax=Rutidosis leptorrhynchoides TaxID=125765 RepID=UPI003A99DA54